MHTSLTIAGSDSSGGAGIQADIKTMMAQGVYAMSAITALTAQNTLGVKSILEVTPAFLGNQIDAVFTDIFPESVKIGMIPNAELIEVTAKKLAFYHAKNIVVDPVMVATCGASLSCNEAVSSLTKKLLPLAALVTPNLTEAEQLSGRTITSEKDMETTAKELFHTFGCAVLLKGGHSKANANDFLYDGTYGMWFQSVRISNPNTHGTGCTLSSAIASHLALGKDLVSSIQSAKDYITGALKANLNLGKGAGPLNHGYIMEEKQ